MPKAIASLLALVLSLCVVAACSPRASSAPVRKDKTAKVDYTDIPSVADEMLPRIRQHVRTIGAMGPRQTGQDGCRQAFDYVRRQLAEALPGREMKEFGSTVTVALERTSADQLDQAEGFSRVVVEGLPGGQATWPAYALYPNCVQACATHRPEQCPAGPCGACEVPRPVVDLGSGTWEDFRGKDPLGAVVLLDFNSGDAWLKAASMGAVGAIFIEPEGTTVFQADKKYLAQLPLNFPRLYVRRAEGLALRSAAGPAVRVTLSSRLQFRNVQAPGLSVTIPGKNRSYCFVLAGHVDARSIVPDLAYGSAETWGIAELLELAGWLGRNQPACDIQIMVVTGHWQSQQVMRDYVAVGNGAFERAGKYYRLAMGVDLSPEQTGLNLLTESMWEWQSQAQFSWLGRHLLRKGGWRDQIRAGLGLPKDRFEFFAGTRPILAETLEDAMCDRNNRSPMVYAPRYHTAEEAWQALGMPTFAFQTGRLARLAHNTPLDRFASPDEIDAPAVAERVRPQLMAMLAVLKHLLDYPVELMPRINPDLRKSKTWGDHARISGQVLEWDRTIGWFAARLPKAVAGTGHSALGISSGGQVERPATQDVPSSSGSSKDPTPLVPNAQCPMPATQGTDPAVANNYRTFVHAFPVDRGFMALQGKRLRNYLHWPMAPARGQHREMQSFMFQDLRLLERGDFRINTIYSALPDTQYNVVAYTLDQAGRIRLATDYGIHGDGNKAFQCTNLDVDDWDLNVPVSLFECGTVELFGLVDPQRYNPNLEVFGDNYQGYVSSHADRGYAPHLKITGVKDVESHTDLERYGFTQYGPTAMVFLPADSIVGAEILLGSYFTNFTVLGQGSGIGLSGTGHLALGISASGAGDREAEKGRGLDGGTSTRPTQPMPNAQCPMPSTQAAPAGFKLQSGQHVRLAGGEGFGPRLFSQQLSDLDHRRLREFAQHDVASPKANRYARDSAQALDAARAAQERRDWKAAAGQYQRGWTFQSEAYRNIVTLLLDVVSTTVLYFVLLIPFSVLLERLVFPQRTALRTVLVAAIIFAVFAGLLYMFHPGFKLANNVIVTTTAFVIVVMTLPALLLLLWRGVAMLRAIGSKAIITTQSEAESAGVVMAALSLAVSNMRRRKLRTGLTLATITLLVVALVLLTTSSAFDFKIMEPTQAGQASAEGIQIMNARDHRMPLLKEMVEQYEGVLGDFGFATSDFGLKKEPGTRNSEPGSAQSEIRNLKSEIASPLVIRREWVNYGYDHKSNNGHIRLALGGRSVPLPYLQVMDWRDGLVPYTLVEGENKRRALRLSDLVQGAFLAEGDVDACLLPNTLADAIGAKVGDTVTAMGLPLRVKGIWEARREVVQPNGAVAYIPGVLDRLTDLDGLPITAFAGAKHRDGMPETPIHASSTEIVIVPRAWLEKNAVFTSCVSSLLIVRPESWSPEQLTDLAARLAREILNVDVYVHFIDERGQSVSRKISMSTATHVQGSSLMLVVMGAAVLMILAIMTGTVYERMREIHIFSSVGLSPRHVAGMFLIEALVYAGVAAVLGYFIGIIALKGLLSYLKSTGQHQDFYPNYLGVFVIYSTGMAVLATVASSLYPIRLASKIVNPGGAGAWKLEPAGGRGDEDSPELDEWLVRLPFIATTQDEARGIMVYAADYLAIHQGERSGRFVCERPPAGTADALPEKPHRDARMSLFMPVWLAPFERNLSQTAELYAQPTADGAWWDMFLKLRRVSGPGYLWRRGATVFVNMLCKHLLRWRAATPQQEADCVARFVDVFRRQ